MRAGDAAALRRRERSLAEALRRLRIGRERRAPGRGSARRRSGARSRTFRAAVRRIARALRAAGIRQAFGGFDVSANEHDADRFAPHYRPHAYLFVPASQFARGEAVFREFFPVSEAVRRPVVAKAFNGYRGGLAYALKTEFQRRVRLPRATLPGRRGKASQRPRSPAPRKSKAGTRASPRPRRPGERASSSTACVWSGRTGGIRFVRRRARRGAAARAGLGCNLQRARGGGLGARVARSPARRNPRAAALEPIFAPPIKIKPPSTNGDCIVEVEHQSREPRSLRALGASGKPSSANPTWTTAGRVRNAARIPKAAADRQARN